MQYFLMAFKRYFDFKSRSSRKEYWLFALVNFSFVFLLVLLASVLLNSRMHDVAVIPWILLVLYALAIIVPSLSLAIRRLHDTGRSWPYIFINLIPFIGGIWFIVLMAINSDKGKNKYGISPKEPNFGTPSPTNLVVLSAIWIIFVLLTPVSHYLMYAIYSLVLPVVILISGILFYKNNDTKIPGILLAIAAIILLIADTRLFFNISSAYGSGIVITKVLLKWLMSVSVLAVAISWIMKKNIYHTLVIFSIIVALNLYVMFTFIGKHFMAVGGVTIFFQALLATSLFPAKKQK